MAFWSSEIDPSTGMPFTKEGYAARLAGVKSKYPKLVDALTSSLERMFPNMNRDRARAKVAEYMAVLGDPPTNPDELKGWVRKSFGAKFRQLYDKEKQDRLVAQGLAKWTTGPEGGGYTIADGVDPAEYEAASKALDEEMQTTWGDAGGLDGWSGSFGGVDTQSSELGLDIQGINDATPLTGGEEDEKDPATRLKAYYDALYSPGDELSISRMAGNQARRASRGAGVRGGLSDASAAHQTANAALGYRQNTNAQALQFMGQDQGHQLGIAQLQQQALQFNAQQRQAAALAAYNQRQQLGGTIGGVAGLIGGGIIQVATGAPVAGAGAAAGTAIGSAYGGGNAPGSYTVRSSTSLRNAATGGKKNDNSIY